MATSFKELLDAGVHFGHLKSKWNPKMDQYIFDEKQGIHVIDLNKTVIKVDEAAAALKQIAKSGRKILFVATKKQAKQTVTDLVKETNMPYITERWSGGMLTNFATIRKAIRKMNTIDKMATDGTFANMSKREKLQVTRQREKLEKNLGSIVEMTRIPAAIFIVDVRKEHIALQEAKRLNIPVFGMVDTNSDPTEVDFVIPANDDATKSIAKIVGIMTDAVKEGLAERGAAKAKAKEEAPAKEEAVAEVKAEKVEKTESAKAKAPAKKEAPKKETPKKKAPAAKAKEEAK